MKTRKQQGNSNSKTMLGKLLKKMALKRNVQKQIKRNEQKLRTLLSVEQCLDAEVAIDQNLYLMKITAIQKKSTSNRRD